MVRGRQRHGALQFLYDHIIGDDPERLAQLECEEINCCVAQLIYDLREEAGLSQQQLAQLIGTTQSVISRLEDADYRGHSLTMLRRITQALGKRLVISAVSDEDALSGALQMALRNLRRTESLTIDQVAEKTGIEKPQLEALENDVSFEPSLDMLRELSRLYEIPLHTLAILAGMETNVPLEIRESPTEYARGSEAGTARKERKAAGKHRTKRKSPRTK